MIKKAKTLLSSNKINLIIILIIGLLPLTWFRPGSSISTLDLDFPLSTTQLSQNIVRYYSLWDIAPPGKANSRALAQLPYQAFIITLSKIGLSLVAIQKILFCLWFAISGLSMYWLTTTVMNKEDKRSIGLFSALFYMLNPYAMVFLWPTLTLSIFLYSLFPLILALFIKGLKSRNNNFLYVFLICVVSLVVLPAFSNPAYAVIFWLILFSYYIFFMFTNWQNKDSIKYSFKFTISLIFIWGIFNIWWILPLFHGFSQEMAGASQEIIGKSALDVLRISSLKSTLLNVFRLGGDWMFTESFRGDLYYPYSPVYNTAPFVLLSFLIPILVVTPFLSKKVRNINLIYFGCLVLLGLFLVKGPNAPFGGIYTWLFTHFPIFGIFRNHYEKFGILVALSYAILFACGLSSIFYLIEERFERTLLSFMLMALVAISILGIYSWPFWTGEVISSGGKILRSAHTIVPDYYEGADNYLKKQGKGFRLFTLPLSKLAHAAYDWDYGYTGADPSLWLFSNPTIARTTSSSYRLPLQVGEMFTEESTNATGKIVGLLNVKYILFHRDTNWEYIKDHSWWISTTPQQYESILNNQEGIHFEKSFGKLDFYKISDEYFLPHVYACP